MDFRTFGPEKNLFTKWSFDFIGFLCSWVYCLKWRYFVREA